MSRLANRGLNERPTLVEHDRADPSRSVTEPILEEVDWADSRRMRPGRFDHARVLVGMERDTPPPPDRSQLRKPLKTNSAQSVPWSTAAPQDVRRAPRSGPSTAHAAAGSAHAHSPAAETPATGSASSREASGRRGCFGPARADPAEVCEAKRVGLPETAP